MCPRVDRLVGSTRDKRRGEERPPVERRNHADPARGLHLCTARSAALCRSPLPAALCPQPSARSAALCTRARSTASTSTRATVHRTPSCTHSCWRAPAAYTLIYARRAARRADAAAPYSVGFCRTLSVAQRHLQDYPLEPTVNSCAPELLAAGRELLGPTPAACGGASRRSSPAAGARRASRTCAQIS